MASGIAAILFALLAYPIPWIGVFLTVVSALFASFCWSRALPLGIAAVLLNVLNLLVFSPSFLVAAGMSAGAGAVAAGSPDGAIAGISVVALLFLGAQALAVILMIVGTISKATVFRSQSAPATKAPVPPEANEPGLLAAFNRLDKRIANAMRTKAPWER